MNETYYLDCIHQGTQLYWHTLGSLNGMSLHSKGIEWVMSAPRGGIERIFNICLPPEQAETAVDELIGMIKAGEAPAGILITPTNLKPNTLLEILTRKGFIIEGDTGSGMAVDVPSGVAWMKLPDHLEVIRVEDTKNFSAWAEIITQALFRPGLFSYEQYHELWKLENTHCYLGLVDGRPVSTSMTLTTDEIATVEMVATLKEYRGRGYASALTAAALKGLSGLGVKTVTLRANKEAVNVYKRIGFVEYYKRGSASFRLDS